jgi:cold shock CspA family protein/ribosome-associated translation inhibitor RaiA
MQVPLEIEFEGIDPSDVIKASVREHMDKLEQFYDRIISGRVVIAKPHQRHHKGNIYSVHIHLALPGGGDIVVNRDPGERNTHEDLNVAMRDSFDAAIRQLQDFARKRQGQVKAHEAPPHGLIATLVYDHGFITSSDGREIYFHRNAVEGDGFDALETGQEVRFAEEIGNEGPQATYVRPVGKHHVT